MPRSKDYLIALNYEEKLLKNSAENLVEIEKFILRYKKQIKEFHEQIELQKKLEIE